MSNLLINEPPLMVLPSLACRIGLNESIILQQVHYWLNPRINKTIKEGYHWVYNSYDQWQEQFSFWSTITIKRTFQSLEKSGLLISKNLNRSGFDKTKWYRIDYEKLKELSKEGDDAIDSNCSFRSDQNDPSIESTCSQEKIKVTSSYIDTETTTDISLSPLIPQLDVKADERGGEEEKINLIAEEMVRAWDAIVREGKGAPTFFRKARVQKLLLALNTYFSRDIKNWKEYCYKIVSSKFLMGETKAQFQTKLDWAIISENIEKILDGSITIGDRTLNSGVSQSDPQEDLHMQAQSLYGRLSSEEIEAYKQRYEEMRREKDLGFVWDDHAPLLSSHLRHFIIMEIKKELVLKN